MGAQVTQPTTNDEDVTSLRPHAPYQCVRTTWMCRLSTHVLDMGDLRGCQQCSDRGNGPPWTSPLRPSPTPVRTAALTYIAKAQHLPLVRLESTGITLNHYPPFGGVSSQTSRRDDVGSFMTKLRLQAKPLRPTVGIDPRATAIPKARAVRTRCAHSGRTKYRPEGPEMTTI